MVTTETIAMGDGVTTEFGFSFPYLKTEDVKVELQEYDATQTPGNQIISRQTITDFVVPSNNPTIVQFSSIGAATNYQAASGAPLANHAVSGFAIRVRIYRFTDTDSIPATFIQGSAVRAQDLNDNFEQTLYIMQERQNALFTIQTGGIGENVISTNALQDDSVDASKLRDSAGDDSQRAVTTNHIRDNAVTTAKIVDDAVTTAKIVDDAVTTAKIVDDAVTTAKITDLNVTTGKLADSAVTSGKIADDTIVNADVNSAAAIDGTKINPDFGSQTITTTGSIQTGNAPLGFNGANYGTQYQIAQSNGSGAANTWVNRSEREPGVSLVSSPLAQAKDIVFDADALSWATKIDVYFTDVSCDNNLGNLIIKFLDQTHIYFTAGSLVGFAIRHSMQNGTAGVIAKIWDVDNGIKMDWGINTSTRYGRVTLVRSLDTQWMVDFQASLSVNPATGNYQSTWNGNGVQTQPSSGTGQLGGIQFVFDVGNIDLGTACVHYS